MTMLAGGKVMVDTRSFQNDLSEIHSKDDALTALIHLGYLAYDTTMLSAFIPNYEVAEAWFFWLGLIMMQKGRIRNTIEEWKG